MTQFMESVLSWNCLERVCILARKRSLCPDARALNELSGIREVFFSITLFGVDAHPTKGRCVGRCRSG